MQQVFGDVDDIKSKHRQLSQEQEKVRREMKRITDSEVTDLDAKIKAHAVKIYLKQPLVFWLFDGLKNTKFYVIGANFWIQVEIGRLKELVDSAESRESNKSRQDETSLNSRETDSLDGEKLALVVQEMTKLKNQIYYIQVSFSLHHFIRQL